MKNLQGGVRALILAIVLSGALLSCSQATNTAAEGDGRFVIRPFLFVSPTGSNANSGATKELPLKTITYALTKAYPIGAIVVALPGTYSAASGESFPLRVPQGVDLFGDVANKGNGPTPTVILGSGLVPNWNLPPVAVTVWGKASVRGFRIDPNSSAATAVACLSTLNTVASNMLYNGKIGLSLFSANDCVIDGNVIEANHWAGIDYHAKGGKEPLFKNNIVRYNGVYGVQIFRGNSGTELDFGGNPVTGSPGNNVFAFNAVKDFSVSAGPVWSDIYAKNNFWSVITPAPGTAEIADPDAVDLYTDGAQLAPATPKIVPANW